MAVSLLAIMIQRTDLSVDSWVLSPCELLVAVLGHCWGTHGPQCGTMILCSLDKCLHLAGDCCPGSELRQLSSNDHRLKFGPGSFMGVSATVVP